jgi:hypothetical protein
MNELRQALVTGLDDERFDHIWEEPWFTKLDDLIPSKWWMMGENGNVRYAKKLYPDDGLKYDPALTKYTESSFTKMVRWMERQEYFTGVVKAKDLQIVQDIIAEYAQALKTTYKFRIVSGDLIPGYYCSGPNSCMLNRKSQVQMYADNPDRVELVIGFDESGVYSGRALLWTLDDDTRFLDRGYPNNTPLTRQMRKWAEDQGIRTLRNDNAGSRVEGDLTVTLPHPKNRRIPYLDTFSHVYRHELNIDSITFHSKGLEEDHVKGGKGEIVQPSKNIDPGDAVGISSLYNDRVKDFAGLPVLRGADYVIDHYQGLTPVVLTQHSAELVYVIESVSVLRSMFVEIDGRLFFKDQVRKVRGEDRYKPKDTALYYYTLGDQHKQDNSDITLQYIEENAYVSE